VVVFHDATAQQAAEALLRRDKDHSETIAAIAANISATSSDTDDVADVADIAEAVTSELANRVADQASFTVYNPATGYLDLLAIAGDPDAAAEGRQMMLDGPVHIDGTQELAQAARSGETTVIDNADPAEFASRLPEPYRSFVLRNPAYHVAHVPLLEGSQLLGVVTVVRFHPDPFDRYDLALIEEVALRAGWAMTNARHFEAQARTELELRESQAVLRSTNHDLSTAVGDAVRERDFSSMLLGAMHEGYLFTVDGEIRDVNEQFCVMTGLGRDELIGQRPPYSFWPSEEFADAASEYHRVQDDGSGDFEIGLTRGDGQPFSAAVSVRVVGDATSGSTSMIATIADITNFKEREDALIAVAGRDPLTGLCNRRGIDERFERLRAGDAVIVLDLDHFKDVNDTHGHAAGDKTLIDLADCITATLRGKDWAGRLGGEEFIIVARDAQDVGARSVLTRLRRSWAATSPLATFSAGVAVHSIGVERQQTLARADGALYLAKHNGRDRTEVYADGEPAPDADPPAVVPAEV
jgi:diguanylate cyclase (GGDEF)-like protein/PAS domain S-box-containing protein